MIEDGHRARQRPAALAAGHLLQELVRRGRRAARKLHLRGVSGRILGLARPSCGRVGISTSHLRDA